MIELDCAVLTHSGIGFWGLSTFSEDPVTYEKRSRSLHVMPEKTVLLVGGAFKQLAGGQHGPPCLCVPVFFLPADAEFARLVYCQFHRDSEYDWFFGLFPEFYVESFIDRAPNNWTGYLSLFLYDAPRQFSLLQSAVFGTDKEYVECLRMFSEDPILKYVADTHATMGMRIAEQMTACRITSTSR